MPLVNVQAQQGACGKSGTQPQGDDPTGGRAGNQVEVIPDGLTVQVVLFQVTQNACWENSLDAAAIQ